MMDLVPIRFVFHALLLESKIVGDVLVCKLLSGPQVLRFCSEFHRRAVYQEDWTHLVELCI